MSDTTPSADREASGRFLPGHKRGGRPRGARDRHSRNFLDAFSQDFEQHGAAVIAKVREEQPAQYLRIAADLLPKEAALDISADINLHDCSSTIEAYRLLCGMIGSNPQLGLRRLKELAPNIIDAEPAT